MIARYDRRSNPGRRWSIAGAAVSLVLGGIALTGAVRADENATPPPADKTPPVKTEGPARTDAVAPAPVEKAAPAEKSAPAEKAAPEKRADPAEKAAPADQAFPVEKSAPADPASPAKANPLDKPSDEPSARDADPAAAAPSSAADVATAAPEANAAAPALVSPARTATAAHVRPASAPPAADPAAIQDLAANVGQTAAADVADPFAVRGDQMAQMLAKIDARQRELKEHPDRGSAQEADLLQRMRAMAEAGVAYADARRQYLQTSGSAFGAPAAAAGANRSSQTASSAGAAPAASAQSAARSNPYPASAAPAAGGQPYRVGSQRVGAAGDVIGIVEDAEAQQADERTAAKLRTKVSPQLDGVSLRDAIAFIAGQAHVELFTDSRSLERTSIIPISVAATDIPAEQALDLILRAGAGDQIGFAIDRGVVVVADRAHIDRMVVTRAYDVSDLENVGDVVDVLRASVAPSSWRTGRSDGPGVGTLKPFGDKLVITQTEPNHRQIGRLLALLRQGSNRQPGQPQQGRPGGANGQKLRDGAANYSGVAGDMPWAGVPPPLRERAQKLWNEQYRHLIYLQQRGDGSFRELNRPDIERQFLDAVRSLEKEQPSNNPVQPRAGAETDPDAASGRDTAAAPRR